MRIPAWTRWLLVLTAGAALWLLLGGPGHLLRWDTGHLGMVLLIASAWGLIHAVSRIPRETLMASASPAEWYARIGFGFNLIAMGYFFSKMHAFNAASIPQNPDASAVARNLVMLMIAWVVIENVLASRWQGVEEQDERDREIASQASGWGRGALIFSIIGIAVMLSFAPVERLAWATPLMLGNLLIFALMWGWLCEYAATLFLYWRDRR